MQVPKPWTRPVHVTPVDSKSYAPKTYRKKKRTLRWCHFHLDIVNARPLHEWNAFDVEDWADWLCTFWDERLVIAAAETNREKKMAADPAYATNRRKTKDSPRGRLTKRALRQHWYTHAMPPWADKKAMTAQIGEMQRLTRETGQQYHVDHIMPLKALDKYGRHIACGLDCEANREVIRGDINAKKWAHFDPDAFVERFYSSLANPV